MAADLQRLERVGHLHEGLEEVLELVALAQAAVDREPRGAHLPEQPLHAVDRADDAVGDEDAEDGEHADQQGRACAEEHGHVAALPLDLQALLLHRGEVLDLLAVDRGEVVVERLGEGRVVVARGARLQELGAGRRLLERALGLLRRHRGLGARHRRGPPDHRAEHDDHREHHAHEQPGVLEPPTPPPKTRGPSPLQAELPAPSPPTGPRGIPAHPSRRRPQSAVDRGLPPPPLLELSGVPAGWFLSLLVPRSTRACGRANRLKCALE